VTYLILRVMLRRTWFVAVIWLALTACSGEGAGGESSPSSPDPADRLETAVQDLTDANTGHFESRLVSMGDEFWSEAGVYRLDPPAYAVTRVHQEGTHTLYVRSVTIGADSWAGLADDGQTEPSCWLKAPPDALASAFGTGQLATGLSLPTAVAVPAGARHGARGDGDTVRAQADLATAAGTLGGAFPELVDLDPGEHARLAIDFDLHDDRFTGWSVTLENVVEAARAAGHPVDGPLTRADANYFATLSDIGDPVTIEPPSEPVVDVGAGSMHDMEDAMADCLGPGASTRT